MFEFEFVCCEYGTMWRYLEGGTPPAKKAKVQEKVVRDRREYEKGKRNRTFQESWKLGPGREWLAYDASRDIMTCKWCVEFASKNSDIKSSFVASRGSRASQMMSGLVNKFWNQFFFTSPDKFP